VMSLPDEHVVEDHRSDRLFGLGRRGRLRDGRVIWHRALLAREVRVEEELCGTDLTVDRLDHDLAGEVAVGVEHRVVADGAVGEQVVEVPGPPVVDLGRDRGVDVGEAAGLDPVADGERAYRAEPGLLPDVGPELISIVGELRNILIH